MSYIMTIFKILGYIVLGIASLCFAIMWFFTLLGCIRAREYKGLIYLAIGTALLIFALSTNWWWWI